MRERQNHFLPECFGDTFLVDTLISANSNHKRGISLVFKSLKEDFKNRHAIGIIDNDKKKDKYFDEFAVKTETDNYIYLNHPNNKHYLLVFKKDLEDFIFACADSVSVKHKYLTNVKTLKKYTKSMNTDGELKNLINTLIQKKAKPLMEIQSILLSHLQR